MCSSSQRKFSKKTSVIQKVESQIPTPSELKSARKIAKGTSVLRAVSPRVRHGFATGSPRVRHGFATGSPRSRKVVHCNARADVFGGPFCVAGAALWRPKVRSGDRSIDG